MAASSITSRLEASRRRFLAALTLGACLGRIPTLHAASSEAPAFAPLGSATVVAVGEDRLLLLDDGRRVRLVGIELPTPGPRGDALTRSATTLLERLVVGRAVRLAGAGNPRDRYGRVLAQVFAGDEWIQGKLLRAGLARVVPFADNAQGVPQMLALEAAARETRRGIWRTRAYAVRAPEEAKHYAGSYELVEGMIVGGALVERDLFLNFGDDWREVLSLKLDAEARRRFNDAGVRPNSLKGTRIRARGYIDGTSRPVMAIACPEQIERL